MDHRLGARMSKRVLLIAAMPLPATARLQRNPARVAVFQHLRDFGWEPISAYRASARLSGTNLTICWRRTAGSMNAFRALDTSKHLALAGAIRAFATPRWASWWLGAVPAGCKLIPAVPPGGALVDLPRIATAHKDRRYAESPDRAAGLPISRSDGAAELPARSGHLAGVGRRDGGVCARARFATFTSPGAIRTPSRHPSGAAGRQAGAAGKTGMMRRTTLAARKTGGEEVPTGRRCCIAASVHSSERDPT